MVLEGPEGTPPVVDNLPEGGRWVGPGNTLVISFDTGWAPERGVFAAKLVAECNYPLTAMGVVNRVITDLAVLDTSPEGFKLVELAPGVTMQELREATGAKIL